MTITKRTLVMLVAILLIVFIAFIVWGKMSSNVEQPKYKIISSSGNIELRQYNTEIVAEVEVKGTRKEAIKKGFRILADYIFGNNTVKDKIAMTAPVQQINSTKIKMTAPVIQIAQGNLWLVRFFMPSQYTIKTLPKPNNKIITIKQLPAQKYLVIRFSGIASSEKIKTNSEKLKEFIRQNKLKTSSDEIYAFFNPPWTLPFLRRNEIMIKIEK